VIADRAEREKALDPARSFIVEAPAGSGKTGLLAQRFLCLLSVVERPETIIAMTFTRKAAAEMRERIHQALAEADRAEEFDETNEYQAKTRELALKALARSRHLGWNLLADPAQLQIQTIDSLCAMLTRQMPVLSEFGDVGKVVEDARDLYKLAARNTLRTLTEGGPQERDLFRRVSLHFDNEMARLEEQVADMLQRREQWAGLPQSSRDPLVEDFSVLLELAGGALRDVFRRVGKVDFTEVARAARKALGTPESPTDLLYSLDYRIEHLLVDEFQDTSRAQYDLVKALTEQWSEGDNRSLFLVGDPMQSIYRFREAEIALFLRCWEAKRLGAVRLERVNLTTNFRSTPELIEWVRTTIGPIMQEEDPQIGAVKFRVSTANRPAGGVQARVVPLIEDTEGAEEAAEIVRLIRSAPKDASIGILVRARGHVTAILPALRRADIAYKAIEIDALKEQQHVMDVLSLTRAVLHAGDRVAWLACLRAPWCGLRLADLAALAENEPERTILDLISDPVKVAALSADGRGRVVRVQQVLAEAVSNVGRLSLRELVERAWLALGGPAALSEENQREDVAEFLDLVGNRDEGGTIRDFSLLNERLEIFYARPFVGECRVEVMTIHQAKGLEFDIVLIPQAARGTRPSEKDLLVWTEETDQDGNTLLRIAAQPRKGEPSEAYEAIEAESKKKEEEENKRLFYVACTRAKNELHVFGTVKRKKDGSPTKAGSHTFLGLVWSSVQGEFESAARRRVPRQQSFLYDAADQSRATVLNRLPDSWRMPKFEMSVAWQPAFERAPASARRITFEWVGDASRHAGTVVHELLKRIAMDGLDHWTEARIEATRPLIRAELLRLGVPATEEPQASNQVVRALANTLNSTRGRWLLTRHAEARSEYAVSGKVEDKLIAATVDRVFRDEDGRFWIVDFKNSDHKGGKEEEFLLEEQRRYTPQLENYATLLRRLTTGPIMLGLYFPLLDAWREWSFAAEVAADI
jgi:ATP-dependent exoDNAse (exonuclease V) beta subunit